MPVTSTRRISSSSTGLPSFSGSSLNNSSYRRSTVLSPSRLQSNSSSVGFYRSLSSSTSYLSNRNSIAAFPSNESSYGSSRYYSKPATSGESGSGSNERSRGSGLTGSRASIARSVALSGVDLYAKYSPANYVPNSELSISRSRSLTDANRGYTSTSSANPSAVKVRKSSNQSEIASNNRRVQVYGVDDVPEEDPNNNISKCTLRRPKVALGGANSGALDAFDVDNKVTRCRAVNTKSTDNPRVDVHVASCVTLSCVNKRNESKQSLTASNEGSSAQSKRTVRYPTQRNRGQAVLGVVRPPPGDQNNNNREVDRQGNDAEGSRKMFLKQTPQRSYQPMCNVSMMKQEKDILLRDECERMRNELLQKKPDSRNSEKEGASKSPGKQSPTETAGHIQDSPMDTTEDNVTSPISNGWHNERLRNNQESLSSYSSNSSSSSIKENNYRRCYLEEIKFIDSDDNENTGPVVNGSTVGRANGKVSRSTLDSLKASTPVIGQHHLPLNGHHTLPSSHSSEGGSIGRLNGGVDSLKKYSTLGRLSSNKSPSDHVNGYGPRAYETRPSLMSKDAMIMGLVPKDSETNAVSNVFVQEASSDALITSSGPPNDKISGKSWEVNGINGDSSIRTSSLRGALPPVSPLRTWERDRPRYRELLDSEPSTTPANTNKYGSSDQGSSSAVEGLCGLRNIGNTCFMNSVLQCLSHTNDLTEFVRNQSDVKTVTKDQRIFAEYVNLIKDMWSSGSRTVTPMELKSAVSSKHRMYSGCGQQDAQEFLRFFLEALHGACNKGTKQEGLTLDDNLSDVRRADLMWDWYSKTEKSMIKDLFVGQLRSTLKCTVCGNTSVTFDPFWDLSVPLPPSSSRCKLENCLELFIREEILDGDEMPTCSKCKARRKSTKSFTIQRFPKYLVIHLKRFSETRWSKLTNVVEFPTGERGLNLAPYASNNTSGTPVYTLYGISNHMGSTAGGHYVALCKHPRTGEWHEFNDNHVSPCSESSLISSSAYLLFFERA